MLPGGMSKPGNRKKAKRPTLFGALLVQYIVRRGLSQRQFSALVGHPNSMISRAIYGERRANPEWLNAWARALALTPDETDAFIRAGKTARLLGKSDSSDHAEELVEALRTAIALTVGLAAILEDEGRQIPKQIAEGLRILQERWQ